MERPAALSLGALFKARQLPSSIGQESRQPSSPGWGVNAAGTLMVTLNSAVMAAGSVLRNAGHGYIT